jgi:hypothetical protein
VRLAGVRLQVKPVEGLTLEVRPTVPLNPWMAVSVIVAVPAVPEMIVTLVGAAATAKSWMT